VTEDVRQAGGSAEYIVCDLADGDSIRGAVDWAVQTFARLDVAFNNCATFVPVGHLDEVAESDFEHAYTVNLKGVSPQPCLCSAC